MTRRAEPAAGGEPPVDERAVRRQRQALVVVLVVVVLIGVAAGVSAAVLDGGGHSGRRVSTAGVVVAVAVPAAVLLVLVPWLVWLTRRPGYRRVMQYDRRRRARVGRALRQGRTLPPEDLPVAAALVAVLRRQWWVPWLFAAVGTLWVVEGVVGLVGGAVALRGPLGWFVLVLGVVYVTVLLPVVLVQRRRTLHNHDRLRPGPAPHSADGK